MAIVDDLSNLKKVDIYSYCDDGQGNIELNFKVENNNYKLVIIEKDLKFMKKLSELGKKINKSLYQ